MRFGRELAEQKASVVVWTTTPWTIPQNRAICFNPDLKYGLYRVTAAPDGNWARPGDLYLLADELAEEVMGKAKVESCEKVRAVSPDELSALTCAHPFRGLDGAKGEWDFDVPLLPGDHVTDEAGTGFVHTAPSHGADDFEIGQKYGLPMTHNVLEDGSFRADLPFFGGAVILDHKGREGDANKRVIDKLAEAGALIARGRLTHSYPHSWRSKAPLIFRNTPQWFVAIDKKLDDGMSAYGDTIRQRALTSIDTLVEWTPPSGRNRLHAMIEQRPDWVLSRQRAWGVPLTCFMRRTAEGVEVLQNDEVNRRITAAFRAEGADAWFADGAKERFLGNLAGVSPGDWEQVTDILDVWFDSGSTHAFALRDRPDGIWPASLYLEGTDQHRGWFHSSLLQACGTRGRAPYEGVLTHGFALDEQGRKMSKALGNGVAPQDVMKQYGADILRLWVAQSDYTADLRIGPEILKGAADSYRRLRNTFRYMLGALGQDAGGQGAHPTVAPADCPELERWVLHRLAELDAEVRQSYRKYDFQDVYQRLFQFCTTDLSAYWFDIRKDALYCDPEDSPRRRACLHVMAEVFARLTTWLAPILPFTMEEVWLSRHPGEEDSVHLQDFPATPAEWRQEKELGGKWAAVWKIRRVVTGALELERKERRIGASLEAAPIVYVEADVARAVLGSVDLAELCITSNVTITGDPAPAEAFRLPEVPGVAVVPSKAQGEKCQRCWRILPEVGNQPDPHLCCRCQAVVHG